MVNAAPGAPVGFTQLGQHGRLGNQLFQIAAVLGAARRFGMQPVLPPDWPWRSWFRIPASTFAPLPADAARVQEPHYCHVPLALDPARATDLFGYFQSWRYFDNCADELRSWLAWPVEPDPRCFIHLRRGDYTLRPEVYVNLAWDYYAPAIERTGARRFVVLSDDMADARALFAPLGARADFCEDEDPIRCLRLMSSCASGIIANSSFSWWGAWLMRPGSRVFAPARWFGPQGYGYYLHDLFPAGWEVIP